MSDQKYYITTAISYPNGAPHIGHAYEALATDALARFMRLDGRDVFFLTGTDEHGIKMKQTALRDGLTPRELADRNTPLFQKMVRELNCSNNDFIRTTDPRHYAASKEIWRRMMANGDIYKDAYAGWYSVRDEAYYAESETEVRADDIRYGPQGTPVEWVEEESYFFRLSAYQEPLLAHYAAHPDFIGPEERRNEVVSFVKGGLRDLSISRTTFDWGIPVPDDPAHVMYVWVDALTNYITGVGFPDNAETFARYWPADLHVIGKDIVRFHAVYWPAFLISAGVAPPKRVYAHGFLFNRGEKMSKSVGNVVDPFAMIDAYGVDAVRYFFLREVPFGQDGNYSHDAIVQRINSDLANDLGNLAQRSLSMIAKNCDGVMPEPGALAPEDTALLGQADALLAKCRVAMAEQQIHIALNVTVGARRRGEPLLRGVGAVGVAEDRYRPHGNRPLCHRRGGASGGDPHPADHAGLGGAPARSPRRAPTSDAALPNSGRAVASPPAWHCPRRAVSSRASSNPRTIRPRPALMIVDSHCHLDFPDFDADRDALVERARAAGVETMVTISTRVAKYPALKAIVERYDDVYCSIGTHPHNAAEEPDVTAEDLIAISAGPKVVAIGEAGLDYHYDNAPHDAQRASFLRHIAAARETGLPLVIHARDADDDMAAILTEETGKGAFPAILHCFSSGRALALTGIALGLHVSFSGILTFKRSDELRAIAAELPLDRLLVETDAPYLAPVPHRGQRNEPAYVVETAKILAETRGIGADDLAAATSDNFYRLFNKIKRP